MFAELASQSYLDSWFVNIKKILIERKFIIVCALLTGQC